MELYLISVLWLLIKPQKKTGKNVYYIERVGEGHNNLRSRDMTSSGSVETVMSLVRNGEDIATEHWYDPASARVRAEN